MTTFHKIHIPHSVTLALSIILGMALANHEFHLQIEPEWKLHSHTVMVWPATASIWGSQSFLDKVRKDIATIAKAILPFEPVTLVVDPDQIESAKAAFSSSELVQEEDSANKRHRISILPLPVDDLWARDTLPVFAIQTGSQAEADAESVKPTIVGIDLNFNGWGNKQRHSKDGPLASSFLQHYNISRLPSKLVGEGGGLEFDGEGTLLLTESSWLNTNRNPDYSSRSQMETELKALFQVEKVIWFKGVKDKDITDAHVDCLVRFVAPGVVILNRPPKGSTESDVWSKSSDEAKEILEKESDAKGRKFRIFQLHEPDPDKIETVKGREDEFLSSYVNFLVVNGGVIMPAFGDVKADEKARKVIQLVYPDRNVVSVKVTYLASGGGGIHCATHDIPSLDGIRGEKN